MHKFYEYMQVVHFIVSPICRNSSMHKKYKVLKVVDLVKQGWIAQKNVPSPIQLSKNNFFLHDISLSLIFLLNIFFFLLVFVHCQLSIIQNTWNKKGTYSQKKSAKWFKEFWKDLNRVNYRYIFHSLFLFSAKAFYHLLSIMTEIS